MVKPSRMQAFAHRSALARSKCVFENRIKTRFSSDLCRHTENYSYMIHSSSASTIVQQRTSVLDKTACMCSKISRVDNTKAYTIDPSRPCLSARRRGFPRTTVCEFAAIIIVLHSQGYSPQCECSISSIDSNNYDHYRVRVCLV